MKLPNNNDGCVISINWWIILLFLFCIGEPDLLDAIINYIISQTS